MAISRTSDYQVTAECIKIANSKLVHVASERDALQSRVKRLEEAGDMIWKKSGYMEPPKYWTQAKEANP